LLEPAAPGCGWRIETIAVLGAVEQSIELDAGSGEFPA
jgi:hypothetical protein